MFKNRSVKKTVPHHFIALLMLLEATNELAQTGRLFMFYKILENYQAWSWFPTFAIFAFI